MFKLLPLRLRQVTFEQVAHPKISGSHRSRPWFIPFSINTFQRTSWSSSKKQDQNFDTSKESWPNLERKDQNFEPPQESWPVLENQHSKVLSHQDGFNRSEEFSKLSLEQKQVLKNLDFPDEKSFLKKSPDGKCVPLLHPNEMHIIDEMTIKDILKKRVHPSTSNKFFTLVCRKWRPEDVFYSLSSIIPIQTFRYKVITNYQQINRKEQYLMRIRRRLRESIRYALPIVGKLRYDYLFIGREAVHDAEWKTLKDEVQRALGLSRLYDENVRNRRGGLSYSEFIEQVGYKNELDSSSQDGRKYKGKNSYSGREVNWEYLASEVGNIEEYMMGTNYFGQLDCNNIDRPYNGHQGDNLKKMYKREANDYNGMQSHELGPPPEWDD